MPHRQRIEKRAHGTLQARQAGDEEQRAQASRNAQRGDVVGEERREMWEPPCEDEDEIERAPARAQVGVLSLGAQAHGNDPEAKLEGEEQRQR